MKRLQAMRQDTVNIGQCRGRIFAGLNSILPDDRARRLADLGGSTARIPRHGVACSTLTTSPAELALGFDRSPRPRRIGGREPRGCR